jgi:hypothetical protein
MTTPPGERPSASDPEAGGRPTPATPERVSLDKPPEPFDPYRYGAPEHPVPAEYAPPGYSPPPVTGPPPGMPAQQYVPPAQPGYGYPGPQQPYAAPPPYPQQYPQPRTGNGKAIAALVLGILAIFFCWTSIFDVVFVALALIFGFLGLGESKRGAGGRGMALSGIACAVVGALFATVLTVVIYSRVRPCLDDFDRGTSAQQDCIDSRL